MSNQTKWVLSHGIHRGTITSRDSTVTEHDTRQDALDYFANQKRFYKSIGYFIWFANLTAPDGTGQTIDSSNVSYAR